MLGVLDLRADDGLEVRAVLTQPRRLALLIHLAVTAARGFQRRDRLLGMFWPEQDNEHARAALNRAIYYLRHELGSDVLISRGSEELGVSAQHLWSDVAAFEKAVNEGRRQDALDLYQGDLLESFFISDAPDFEQWLDVERNRVRLLASRVARELATAEDAAGNHAVAAQWARWALERGPYEEAALQQLMVLLDRAGDRAGAVHAYEQFASRLGAELDVEPSPETRLLLERIRSREQSAVGAPVPVLTSSEQNTVTSARDAITADASPPAVTTAAISDAPVRDQRRPGGSQRRLPRKTGMLITAVLATVVVSSIFAIVEQPPALDPTRILVIPFENNTGDPSLDPLGVLTSDVITKDLPDAGARFVSQGPDVPAQKAAATPRTRAEDDDFGIVISGAYYRVGAQLRFEAQVLVAADEPFVWAIPAVSVPADSARAAVEQIRQRALGAVAAMLNPRFASWFALATAPPTIDAFRAFASGIVMQLSGQFPEALTHLQRAVEFDSTFTWAYMQSAVVHGNLGQNAEADAVVAAMEARRDELTQLQLHWLDWMIAMRREDDLKSYLAMERAAELAPDRFLYMQAEIARWLNRPYKTAELLERLGPNSPYDGGGADYWFNLAEAYHQVGNRRSERAAARLAKRQEPLRAHAVGPYVLLAAARGRIDELNAWLDTMQSYPDENRFDYGEKATQAGEELMMHGHADDAGPILQRAIDYYRSGPQTPRGPIDPRFELARTLAIAGQLEEADTIASTLTATNADDVARNIGLLGTIAARRGNRPKAEGHIADLEALKPSLPRPDESATFWQARIRAVLGDHDEAIRLLRKAFGPQGQDLHHYTDFQSLARNPDFIELIRPKG